MLLKKVIEVVESYFNNLNKEFFSKKVKWSVLDRYDVDGELNLTIEVYKNGTISIKKYVISNYSSDSYRLRKEDGQVQIVLKEEIAKRIAIDSNGGQVQGVPLLIEEIPMEHLALVPAT